MHEVVILLADPLPDVLLLCEGHLPHLRNLCPQRRDLQQQLLVGVRQLALYFHNSVLLGTVQLVTQLLGFLQKWDMYISLND